MWSGSSTMAFLLPVFVFAVCMGTAPAMYFGPWTYGVVKPDHPYLFVDEDLVLFCNLTKLDLLEDSSYLYFTRNGMEIQSQFVTILNTRSVRLNFPIRQPQDEGHFVCWLRQEQGNPRTIGSQSVKADYRPVKVRAVNCTVYNWENMTCSWDLGRNYHHPDNIRVSLVWTISDVQKDCPLGHMTNTSCTWVSEGPDRFLQGYTYIMSVEVKNTKRGITTQSNTFHINSNSIVKPSAVSHLHKSGSNATCLRLEWDHSDVVNDKVAYVEYLSEWDLSHWHQLKQIHFKRESTGAELCELMPFTVYTVRVAVRPLPRNNQDGYRSDWKYIERVRTDQLYPDVAPEMCVGCYSEQPCERSYHCRNVIVYWRHIPWSLRRSVIHSYQLLYKARDSNKGGNSSTKYPNSSLLVSLDNSTQDYTLSLYAVTSKNKTSREHSSLFIPAKANKPQGPGGLMVETDYGANGSWSGQFDLQWVAEGQPSASFLVAWCRGNTATLTCDHEEKNQMEWQEVGGDSVGYTVTIESPGGRGRPGDYMVGVARQLASDKGKVTSSGIVWTPCYFRKHTRPRFPKNVDFSKVDEAGSLRVTWDYSMCERTEQDVYVTRFILFFCVIADTSASSLCQGSEHNTTVQRDARSILLRELQQGAYYKVSMVADSQWGASTRPQPVISRVLAAPYKEESRDFSMIGVVLAILVIIILIAIALCKLRSRFRKSHEKFTTSLDNPLPPLPNNTTKLAHHPHRPLPMPPPGSTATPGTTATSGLGASVAGDKKQRGGGGGSKHKSITSETSLLGSEEQGLMEDSRRRHKSGANLLSERSKLLVDDSGVTMETSLRVSKYDSDSGAESRNSSDDHDYASVEGGSAEEGSAGLVGSRSSSLALHASTGAAAAAAATASKGTAASQQPRAGHKADDNRALGHGRTPSVKSEHKPAPSHAPPPLPLTKPAGFNQATLLSSSSPQQQPSQGLSMVSFKPLQAEKPGTLPRPAAGSHSQHSHHLPAQLTVALETVSSASRAQPLSSKPGGGGGGGYVGSEDATLQRRPPGTKLKQPVLANTGDDSFTPCVDPYASTNVASFSSPPPPSSSSSSTVPPPPPTHTLHAGKGREMPLVKLPSAHPPIPSRPPVAARGYVPHPDGASGRGGGGNSAGANGHDSRLSSGGRPALGEGGNKTDNTEPIYSPPWENNTLVPFAIDNRPLSEYMLKLPDNFFDSSLSVNGAPTTEL